MLASGSSGNSALLTTAKTRILVDAGLSVRELRRRMAEIQEDPEQLDAIVVTHEHSDHIAGLARLVRWLDARGRRVPVYLTHRTAPVIDWNGQTPAIEGFQAGARFPVGDIEVQSFTIPHDAADPVGFCFQAEGLRIAVATDLGYITESVRYHLRAAEVLLLESNHDLEMLKVGPYPWSVKQRVMSRVGHLSNDGMREFLIHDLGAATTHLILGHLSEQNNHPEIVRMMAAEAIERRGLPIRFEIASQKRTSGIFEY